MAKSSRLKTVAIILAGGAGSRLKALTHRRAKPVLPFGGTYRLIDVPLSNLHHSEISDVWVVEQYRPHGLNDHLRNGRPWDLDRTHGGLVVLPPYQGKGESGEDSFAAGNAEALNQQRELIEEMSPDHVLVLSADHLYRCDYRDLIDFHTSRQADLSVLTWQAPESWDLTRYSIFQTDGDRVTDFAYKPKKPQGRLLGTEVFLYSTEALVSTLRDLEKEVGDELGDYGDHLLPKMVKKGNVRSLELEGYWRDVGTIESYWQAHQDLLEEEPEFLLDAADWPILTDLSFRAPARLGRSAKIDTSLVSSSCRVDGSVTRSVVGPGCVIEKGAVVEDSILLDGCRIGSKARVRKAIVDVGSEVNGSLGDGQEIVVHSPEADRGVKAARSRLKFH